MKARPGAPGRALRAPRRRAGLAEDSEEPAAVRRASVEVREASAAQARVPPVASVEAPVASVVEAAVVRVARWSAS